ncbi:MAG: hypothetical protein ACK5LF_26590 [Bacteroides xylanisolvens]
MKKIFTLENLIVIINNVNKGDRGKLILAWAYLRLQAGYCLYTDFERWFEK